MRAYARARAHFSSALRVRVYNPVQFNRSSVPGRSLFRAHGPRRISRKSNYRSVINIAAIWRRAKAQRAFVRAFVYALDDRALAVGCSFFSRANGRSDSQRMSDAINRIGHDL